MKRNKLERRVSAVLYDKQITGKKFLSVKKSFQEVAQFLQSDRKK